MGSIRSTRFSCFQIKPNVGSFDEKAVVFEDGTRVEDVDVVIFATGFSFGFPVVEKVR